MARFSTLLAVLLVGALAFPPLAAAEVAPTDVADDPDVVEQRERLERSRALLEATALDLTAAAEAYEHTRDHAERLAADLDDTERVEQAAVERTLQAQETFRRQVRATYAARPEILLTEALLASPDPTTALRRADLLRGTTSRSSQAFHRAEQSAGMVSADAGLHRDLVSAVTAAVAERRVAADELEAALARAASAAEAAESDFDAAVQEAMERERRRIAEERRRQEAERRAAAEAARAAQASSAPIPDTSGRVCPIGEPHGFIDSWGFARPGGRRHQGVDIFAARGTPVYAIADGTVSRVGSNRLGGLVVDLVDGDGHRYYYAHLDSQRVSKGQRVTAGTVLGTVGNSGNARGTPPHLHWEFRPGQGAPVNPYPLARTLCNPTHRGS